MKKFLLNILLAALLISVFPASVWANSGAAEEGGEGGEEADENPLAKLNPFLIPILKGNRVLKYIVVKVSLEPVPEADMEAITRDLPRVVDAVLREVYLFAKENAGADDVDLEALRTRLLPVINAALGGKKINALYFTGTDTLKI